MVQRYFENFPITQYSNTNIVDITKRVALLESVSKNPYAFYPYEIDVYERPDQFSYRYYQDPYQSWLVYLTNKIVDPYYEWYLSENEFIEFLEKKYGSVYDAQSKIKYYRNNWINVENISLETYNTLSNTQKDYWEPVVGSSNKIVSYSRKQIDWTINTNKIMAYAVSNTSFIKDEVVNIVYNSNSGRGQVLSTTNTHVFVQHVSGFYDLPNGYIYGNESTVNTSFSNSIYCAANNISDEEQIYWSAVSYYDHENNKNEFNKTIRVLDNRYSGLAIQNIRTLLSNT